jgi:hypothetical protein
VDHRVFWVSPVRGYANSPCEFFQVRLEVREVVLHEPDPVIVDAVFGPLLFKDEPDIVTRASRRRLKNIKPIPDQGVLQLDLRKRRQFGKRDVGSISMTCSFFANFGRFSGSAIWFTRD